MSDRADRVTHNLISHAQHCGFDAIGVVPAGPTETHDCYQSWVDMGYSGKMGYLSRPDVLAKRKDPRLILAQTKSIVVVAWNYHTHSLSPEILSDPSRGIIASYAWGEDYHRFMVDRLERLGTRLADDLRVPVATRAYTDTGPILEREWGYHAGLGFFGRNTHLISPHIGSWFFLGELLVSEELPPLAAQMARQRGSRNVRSDPSCGNCTRCLDACPTGALVAPNVLDARRCISYLTIELRDSIPRALRPALGNRIFGCDVCQQVCPWNRRFAKSTRAPTMHSGSEVSSPQLLNLVALDEMAFRSRFATSPILRAKHRGLVRNVCVALGNWGNPVAVGPLTSKLADVEPLVRGHAAWALGQIGTAPARRALHAALTIELDAGVRDELHQALSRVDW